MHAYLFICKQLNRFILFLINLTVKTIRHFEIFGKRKNCAHLTKFIVLYRKKLLFFLEKLITQFLLEVIQTNCFGVETIMSERAPLIIFRNLVSSRMEYARWKGKFGNIYRIFNTILSKILFRFYH